MDNHSEIVENVHYYGKGIALSVGNTQNIVIGLSAIQIILLVLILWRVW